jgi:glycosyltransferase involved in cell wall biosynthesis
MLGHYTQYSSVITGEVFEQFDVVIVRGLHHPINSQVWRWASNLRDRALLVYDMDDDIWAWNPAYEASHYWNDERRYNAELNIQHADLVTTPTTALADILCQLNPRVAVIPNTIPATLLNMRQDNRGRFVVGWQGGDQHATDLQQIYPPVFQFLLRYRDVAFHVWGGAQTYNDLPAGIVERIVHHPWQQSVWQYYFSLSMDVGLAPLDMAETFNLTKSDIRLREYAGLGIPFIASMGPTYGQTALASGGLLAADMNDWREYLTLLYNDRKLREQLSIAGRKAARRWTTEANASALEARYVRASHAARTSGARIFRPARRDGTERITEISPSPGIL